MTDVRSSVGSVEQGLGLYATKEYKCGDVILEESPLLTLAPPNLEEIRLIRSQFSNLHTPDEAPPTDALKQQSSKSTSAKTLKKQKKREKANAKARAKLSSSPLHDLLLPPSIPSNHHAKCRSMILALASYATSNDESAKAKLLTLYAPTPIMQLDDSQESSSSNNPHETPLLQLASDTILHLQQQQQQQQPSSTTDKDNDTQPSSIVAPSTPLSSLIQNNPQESQKVMLLWACNAFSGARIYERTSRINHSCDFNAIVSPKSSVETEVQVVRAVCTIAQGDEIHISYLGSWTYADRQVRRERLKRDKYFECQCDRCCRDDAEGDIAASIPCTQCHERVGRFLEEEVQYDDEGEVLYTQPLKGQGQGPQSNDSYLCPKSLKEYKIPLDSELHLTMKKTVEKAVLHLEDADDDNKDDDDDDERLSLLEQLASLSSSVLGAKHWCTNLLLMQQADKRLASLHGAMLVSGTNDPTSNTTVQERLDMTEVAECIDDAERLWNFVKGLKLKSHPGHLLGSLTIGVARLLVGLGDEKSMKYGAEWAERVNADYYEKGFEGDGMVKVVHTLLQAWKREDKTYASSSEDNRKKKKPRID